MSTFYLLPPRPVLAERMTNYLSSVLPGLDLTRLNPGDVTGWLEDAVGQHRDVYVVYREELPAGEEPRRALRDGFGAETGDEVVEVRAGIQPGELTARRYRLDA